MESKAIRDLRQAMSSGRFPQGYYIFGEDEYRKDELLRELQQVLVDAATRDFNLDVFRGADVQGENIESLLNTPPMMSARRGVIVRDTASLKKDARATIERYLERPSPDTVLVLVAVAGTKEERAFSAKCQPVAVEPLVGTALTAWLVSHAQAAHQIELSTLVADELVARVGSDTVQLAAEVDKLVSFAQGDPVTVTMVKDVVGGSDTYDLGTLLDAVAARDTNLALQQVEIVLTQPKMTAVFVIMALTVQTLALAWGVASKGRGVPAFRMGGEFMGLLKETGAFPARSWGDATRAWAQNLPRWDEPRVHQALRALRAADQGVKDSRVSTDAQLLSTLICAMCADSLPRRKSA